VDRGTVIKFHKARLEGAYTIELERRVDERGFFARFFCEKEFSTAGLETYFPQINNSASSRKGAIRGLHYQLAPNAEVKVMRCVRGMIYDVIVDLRAGSPTFLQWFGAELTAQNRIMMYVPRGFAHGFLSLTDDVEVVYMASAPYAPESERGLRWNDPAIGIEWPIKPIDVSEKDRNWPDFDSSWHGAEILRGFL
jgi:dTDP-4-dehydrorhamnose 3,5-epimerase